MLYVHCTMRYLKNADLGKFTARKNQYNYEIHFKE